MDVDDWEILNHEHENENPNHFSEEKKKKKNPEDKEEGVVNMEYYFTCKSPPSVVLPAGEINPNNHVEDQNDAISEQEIKEISIAVLPDVLAEMGVISQLFLKKLEDDDSVNMKIEHPTCIIREFYQSEDSEEFSSEEFSFEDHEIEKEKKKKSCKGEGDVSAWGLSGARTLCSIGAAAATLCVLLFSGCPHKTKRGRYHQNQEIVEEAQQTSKLNQAVPVTKPTQVRGANISFEAFK
ncbi:hypothetical protein J5N97_016181 [Dioscorea zingiberensis]|uniref:DUF6821 domain-containing protein n=1 Tax=Dioscorea zingiberensis TaxID=325984 RepID=A0A9D5CJ58_9LILI|nr:hypothetical protein J5N97_016181 [Dioscorea zingiberensis]